MIEHGAGSEIVPDARVQRIVFDGFHWSVTSQIHVLQFAQLSRHVLIGWTKMYVRRRSGMG